MYMRKYNLLNKEIHTTLFKNTINEETEDYTFTKWKLELQRELPFFWESMEESIKPRHKFSHSS